MKLYKSCILLFLLSISSQPYAKQYEYTGTCKFIGDMEIFKHCLDKESVTYDKELNDLYSKIFKRGHDDTLKKTETLWIKFKKSDCAFMADAVNDGIYFQVVEQACLINKTKERIADLKRSFFFSEWFESNP